MPVASFARVFAIALAAAFSCQSLQGQGFSPAALPVPSTINFSGSYYNVANATTDFESGSMTTTSATAFTGTADGENVAGTYSYAKTGANTAGHNYSASTSGPGYWYSETGTFNLTFTSATGGTYTVAGSYQGEDSGFPYSGTFINGVGTFTYSAPGPEIAVEQPVGTNITDGGTNDFGTVAVGSNTVLTFTIKNTGTANLTGLAITKDGTHQADFTVGTLGSTTVAAGASTSFTVTFAPGAAGSRSAAIHLASNDADENPFDLSLTGTSVVAISLPAALDQPTWTFTTSGSLPWTGQSNTTHDGVDAAKSDAITHSQASEMSTTLNGLGTLTFWWKVSSESGYDHLSFYIDGVEQAGKISGTVDWTQKSYSLTAGSHTLKWAYTKDVGTSSGSDCGWVDQIAFVPAVALPEIAVEQPAGTAILDGSSTNFGTVAMDSSAQLTLTIRNTGPGNLTGLAITKDGSNAADFTIGSLGATSVATGASTTFTVTFAPSSTGSRAATIRIANNDIDENPFDMNLSGTGTSAGDFTYQIVNGTVTITRYTGPGGVVVIPASISGSPVTSIGSGAFSGGRTITSVNIPASIASIGSMPFSYCPGLTSFTVDAANANYTSSDDVLFDKALTTLIHCPAGKTGVYSIPASVTRVENSAFDWCDRLTEVSVPANTVSIGDSFNYCTSMRAILVDPLNPSYASADGVLFNKGFTTLIQCPGGKAGILGIPDTVTSIPDYAFFRCVMLTSITVAPLNPNYSGVDGVLYNKDKTTLIQCPAGKSGGLTIVATVTRILAHAFNTCSKLTSVIIPDGVHQIDYSAFYDCDSLTHIELPGNLTAIEPNLFMDCDNLARILIPASVTNIAPFSFTGCTSLTSATFLGNAPTIGVGVFDDAVPGFTICYDASRTGFTTPTWQGYPALPLESSQEISMTGPAGALADGGTGFDFGNVHPGTILTRTFVITNAGLQDLTGLAITKSGSRASDFTVGNLGTTTLASGASTAFTITFAPGAAGSRSAAIHIASNDSDENAFDIALSGTGLTLQESWRQTYFGTPDNTGIAANTADPDKDGLNNLLEYAFNLHPFQSSAHLAPRFQHSGNNLTCSFTQPTGVSGITYGAEWSPTIAAGTWLPLTDTGTAPQHTFTVPMTGNLQKFVRLKVTTP